MLSISASLLLLWVVQQGACCLLTAALACHAVYPTW
jgi:hypothetical protein